MQENIHEPYIAFSTRGLLGPHISAVINKDITKGCEEAAQTRAIFGLFNGKMGHMIGAPLEYEIRTSLFLAEKDNGKQIYIAAHTPANMKIASNGIVKKIVFDSTGIQLVKGLNRTLALDKLNEELEPVLKLLQASDKSVLASLNKNIANTQDRDWAERYEVAANIMQAHIDDPSIKHGELNPWTLLLYNVFHSEVAEKEPFEIVNIIDSNLANNSRLSPSKGLSTTNMGSRHLGMTLKDTDQAFVHLKNELNTLPKSHYIESDEISRDRTPQIEGR